MSNTKMSRLTKAAALARVQAFIAGTQKHFPGGQFTLGNVVYTAAVFVQILTVLAKAMTDELTADGAARDALANVQALSATGKPLMGLFERYVRATFEGSVQNLADFGLQPPKARTPMTAEAKAAAKAKAEATRKARGTTSKKQKLSVTGNVTGVVVTPITAPASPAAPAAPVTPEPAAQPASSASSASPTAPVTK